MIASRFIFLIILLIVSIILGLWFSPMTEKYSNFFQDEIPNMAPSPAPVDSSKYEISEEINEQIAIMNDTLDTKVKKSDLSQDVTTQLLDVKSLTSKDVNISEKVVANNASFKGGVVSHKPLTISMANGNLVQIQSDPLTGGIHVKDGHLKIYSNAPNLLKASYLDAPRLTVGQHNIVGSSKGDDIRFSNVNDVNVLSSLQTTNMKVNDDMVVTGKVNIQGETSVNNVLSTGIATIKNDKLIANKFCIDQTCIDKERMSVLATKPIGPAGPPGSKGLTGKSGDEGNLGPQGPRGDVGPQGDQGRPGPKGIAGPAGVQGNKGLRGPQGLDGPRGEQGPIGEVGDKGNKGPNAKSNVNYAGTRAQNNKINLEIGLENGQKYIFPVETLWNKVVNNIEYSNSVIKVIYSDGTVQNLNIPLPQPDDSGRYSVKGPNGSPGPQGDAGDKGDPGQDGPRGDPGRSVNSVTLATGNIRITYTDGVIKDIPVEQVIGKYVTGVHRANDSIIVTYSDGTTAIAAKLENKDCVVTWGEWSTCNVLCGNGQQTRDGKILSQPHFNGKPCPSSLKESRACQMPACDRDCVLGAWSDPNPSNCPSCGTNVTQVRVANITAPAAGKGKTCEEVARSKISGGAASNVSITTQNNQVTVTMPCQIQPCPNDCAIGTWSAWTACEKNCKDFQQTRTAPITSAAANNGKSCVDVARTRTNDVPANEIVATTHNAAGNFISQSKICSAQECPCEVSSWGLWGPCDPATGTQTMSRTVTKQGPNCPPLNETQPCPVPCQVSDWSAWTPCDPATGTQSHTRTITSQPKNGGTACPTSLKETQPCPVPCQTSEWSAWSPCDPATGTQARTRTITSQPRNGGTACPTSLRETQPCPVPCQTSEWSIWTPCDPATGTQARTRNITVQPRNGGTACPTSLRETQTCPVPCQVSDWSAWTPCDPATRTQARTRNITVQPRNGGTACPTSLRETQTCQLPCQVSDWSGWSGCNPATGTQTRTRTVTRQGPNCPPLTETQNCPVPCQVSGWSAWATCDRNLGTHARTRTIIAQPRNGGTACPPLQEVKQCFIKGTIAPSRSFIFGDRVSWFLINNKLLTLYSSMKGSVENRSIVAAFTHGVVLYAFDSEGNLHSTRPDLDQDTRTLPISDWMDWSLKGKNIKFAISAYDWNRYKIGYVIDDNGMLYSLSSSIWNNVKPNLYMSGSLEGKFVVSVKGILALDSEGVVHKLLENGGVWESMRHIGSFRGKLIKDIQTGSEQVIALDTNGDIHTWSRSLEPTLLENKGSLANKKIVQIGAMALGFMALDSDGRVHAWGNFDRRRSSQNVPVDVAEFYRTQVHPPSTLLDIALLEGKRFVACSSDSKHNSYLIQDNEGIIYGFGNISKFLGVKTSDHSQETNPQVINIRV
jgi:hypothetical protein